ncbi:hypothetical protein LXA43DRAFT_873097, partial [Ganoderma leucocontextum]
ILQIPAQIRYTLLPSPELSVLGLVKFSLPAIAQVFDRSLLVANFLTSTAVSTEDPATLRAIPIPHPSIVQDLLREVKQEDPLHGYISIRTAHLGDKTAPRYLPLWILTYWSEVITLRAPDGPYTRWQDAELYLQRWRQVWRTKNAGESHSLIDHIFENLASVPWHGLIRGFDNGSEPLHELATYASKRWLSDIHENQMLDLLR